MGMALEGERGGWELDGGGGVGGVQSMKQNV